MYFKKSYLRAVFQIRILECLVGRSRIMDCLVCRCRIMGCLVCRSRIMDCLVGQSRIRFFSSPDQIFCERNAVIKSPRVKFFCTLALSHKTLQCRIVTLSRCFKIVARPALVGVDYNGHAQ